jgi:hypothetical protein
VNGNLFGATDWSNLFLLQSAEQFRLKFERKLAYFFQKDRIAFCDRQQS